MFEIGDIVEAKVFIETQNGTIKTGEQGVVMWIDDCLYPLVMFSNMRREVLVFDDEIKHV